MGGLLTRFSYLDAAFVAPSFPRCDFVDQMLCECGATSEPQSHDFFTFGLTVYVFQCLVRTGAAPVVVVTPPTDVADSGSP